jgi:hypothetical protein
LKWLARSWNGLSFVPQVWLPCSLDAKPCGEIRQSLKEALESETKTRGLAQRRDLRDTRCVVQRKA